MSGSGTLTNVAILGQSGGLAVNSSAASWSASAWYQQLQPGSWRGVGFVLDADDTAAGRRVAIHEYPYRDQAWAEDLGKLPRRFSLQAFLVGDDCYAQRDAMLAACEQPGPGTLVHPTLGAVQCVLLEFQCSDRRERGRVVELQLTFILAGSVLFPSTATATAQAVTTAAANLNLASASDLGASLTGVGTIAQQVTGAVGQFTTLASSAVNDATRIFNSVRGLQGYFGRYAMGSVSVLQDADATVQSALAATTTARTLVNTSAALVNLAASAL